MRVPWTARRSNQSILKEINPEYSLKGLWLKLKLQYFGLLMLRANSLKKTLMLGKIEGRRRSGWQRTRRLDGITDSMDTNLSKLWEMRRMGKPVSCRPWGLKELDMTYRLNNNSISDSFPFSQRLSSQHIPSHLPVSASGRDSIGNLCALVYLPFLLTSRTGSLQTTFFRLCYQLNAT